ncbi:hypothetical protein MCRO_0572 [Mycoplasma crocodyli MP145]|uniref:Uncharacterized protein n=1 Tax=Mycoplasma crocodyli (strain ATCC 51981 / MP145) TaxID=512564 RepID=D5E5Z8_MYCCM|nr:hypothetical protein MCRO_0572 [Mycoplasma crocodyli MP145]
MCSFLIRPVNHSTILLSQSSPPKWLSPDVERTSNVPFSNSRTETSNVPPPRSYTKTFIAFSVLSRPKANAAAVGSLMIRSTSNPAILPAIFVASRCALSKYAGTVITALVIVAPSFFCA